MRHMRHLCAVRETFRSFLLLEPLRSGGGHPGPTRACLVQLEQPRQDLLVRKLRGPAIGGRHRGIQLPVRMVEPGRPLVVELREGPLL